MTKEKTMVLILGMHRSGTSCLAGMLRSSGLYLGDGIKESNNFNKKGNQEHLEARAVNHELILTNGGTWYSPQNVENIPDHLIERVDQLKKSFERNSSIYGIKDPRMIFCLDAWFDTSTQLVGTFRHPENVYNSLAFRNANRQLKVEANWFDTWYAYNKRLLEIYYKTPFPIVNFDWEDKKYIDFVNRISARLGINGEEMFFDPSLKHQNTIEGIAPEYCLDLYKKLCEIANDEYQKIKE
jgi:hypothetical protein